MTHFAINYTFWLNLAFGALALYLFWVSRNHPMHHGHHGHGHEGHRHEEAGRDGPAAARHPA